jgi:polyphenol oxidase
MQSFIRVNWPAPHTIKAYTTTRLGGISTAPYDQFNLGDHVGEPLEQTTANRELLKQKLQLPGDPVWIQQTHGITTIEAKPAHTGQEADASFTQQSGIVCAVLTADCLPVLLCNRQGTQVAAIHAGWRGLANGVIESALKALELPPDDILVWLGPAISSNHFEVGDEVRDQFITFMKEAASAFSPSPNQRWMADLYLLARLRLQKQGITQIYGGEYCTYTDKHLFYSYRRDGAATGRMASLIWID